MNASTMIVLLIRHDISKDVTSHDGLQTQKVAITTATGGREAKLASGKLTSIYHCERDHETNRENTLRGKSMRESDEVILSRLMCLNHPLGQKGVQGATIKDRRRSAGTINVDLPDLMNWQANLIKA